MNKHKHLELIQGIISRMANNSFLLKGWSIVIISALFVLASKDTNCFVVFIAYFPALVFWGLDGYFLRQERLFRALYDKVRLMDEANINYSMDVSTVSEEVDKWLTVVFSKTLIWFHLAILITISFATTILITQ